MLVQMIMMKAYLMRMNPANIRLGEDVLKTSWKTRNVCWEERESHLAFPQIQIQSFLGIN